MALKRGITPMTIATLHKWVPNTLIEVSNPCLLISTLNQYEFVSILGYELPDTLEHIEDSKLPHCLPKVGFLFLQELNPMKER